MSKWTDEQARNRASEVADIAGVLHGDFPAEAIGRRILDLEAELAAMSMTGNPNAVNCDGLPNTEHTLCAIIKTEQCPACAALAELAAMRPVVEAAEDWSEHDNFINANALRARVDAYRAQREGK